MCQSRPALLSKHEVRPRKLTHTLLSAAYWIAFGPHGPRAQAPPGEGSRVFFGTLVAVGVSLTLFGIIRFFARPPPHTMTKEWQEAANEKLRVRVRPSRDSPGFPFSSVSHRRLTILSPTIGATVRPLHRSRLRGLCRQGPGPVAARALSGFALSLSLGLWQRHRPRRPLVQNRFNREKHKRPEGSGFHGCSDTGIVMATWEEGVNSVSEEPNLEAIFLLSARTIDISWYDYVLLDGHAIGPFPYPQGTSNVSTGSALGR